MGGRTQPFDAYHPSARNARAGAQRISLADGKPTGHAAILRAVCEAGCRVDARDVAGCEHAALLHAGLRCAALPSTGAAAKPLCRGTRAAAPCIWVFSPTCLRCWS